MPNPSRIAASAIASTQTSAGNCTLPSTSLRKPTNRRPFVPLDGGWFLSATALCRWARAEAGFKVIGFAASQALLSERDEVLAAAWIARKKDGSRSIPFPTFRKPASDPAALVDWLCASEVTDLRMAVSLFPAGPEEAPAAPWLGSELRRRTDMKGTRIRRDCASRPDEAHQDLRRSQGRIQGHRFPPDDRHRPGSEGRQAGQEGSAGTHTRLRAQRTRDPGPAR